MTETVPLLLEELQAQYDALANKLDVTLRGLEELPAVAAERRRIETLTLAHDATVAELRAEIARLSVAVGRMDPADGRHRHPPGEHLHTELNALPGLELGLRTLRNELGAMLTRPVAAHAHEDLVGQAEYGGALRSLQQFVTGIAEGTSALEQRLSPELARVREQIKEIPPHRHDDVWAAFEDLSRQVNAMDRALLAVQEAQATLEEVGRGFLTVGETLTSDLLELRGVVRDEQVRAAGLTAELATHDHDARYAALEHTHELISDEEGARGSRHFHAWVLTGFGPGKQMGTQTLFLRCDVPGCGQKISLETR